MKHRRKKTRGSQQELSSDAISRRNLLKSAAGAAAGSVAAGVVQPDSTVARESIPAKGGKRNLTDRLKSTATPIKQRARRDYAKSLACYGGRLSNPIRQLFVTSRQTCHPQFGVVIIGSGYGAFDLCGAAIQASAGWAADLPDRTR